MSTFTGMPDFIGDTGANAVCTMSPGGPGRLIDCLKCADCGWSVMPGYTAKPYTSSNTSSTRRLVAIDAASRLASQILNRNALEVELSAFCDGYGKAVVSAILQQLSHVKTSK